MYKIPESTWRMISLQWALPSLGDQRSVNWKGTDKKNVVHVLLLPFHSFPTGSMFPYQLVQHLIIKAKHAYRKHVKCKCTVQ